MKKNSKMSNSQQPVANLAQPAANNLPARPRKEVGGQKGPEPTRYGDWEKNGRCSDF